MITRASVTLFFLLIPFAAFASPAGRVTKLKGEVAGKREATAGYSPLSTGSSIEEGGWIRTGKDGWVELILADNSRFTIANNTEIQVARFVAGKEKREGTLNLVQGKLRASVVKLAGRQTDFKVRSGTAVAGIKGTEFLMLARGPANVLFGSEGVVAVSGTDGGTQSLTADMFVQTTRGQQPLSPVKVEPGTTLATARASFEAATGAAPPAEWGSADAVGDVVARWNINYGHYLADAGAYDDALHVFQLALDLTDVPAVRADALLERGAAYGRNLKNPEAALGEYLLVLELYPDLSQAETALFTSGQVQYEMGLLDQARARFHQYLDRYPRGRYRSSTETLLRLMDR